MTASKQARFSENPRLASTLRVWEQPRRVRSASRNREWSRGFDHRVRPRAVFVRERAFKHVVMISMSRCECGKAARGFTRVFVDDFEFAETHMLRIIIIAERERVPLSSQFNFVFPRSLLRRKVII
jgi:hypothetical protein